jgi:hypothetical protein
MLFLGLEERQQFNCSSESERIIEIIGRQYHIPAWEWFSV